MQIIEQNLVAKDPKRKSEDGIVITDDFIAVIDGSTSKTDRRYCLFKSNGRFAMQIIEKYIRKAIACKEECPERAEVYRKLSEEELGHMSALHDEVVREIKQWKEKTGQTPPPEMQAKYDLLHEIIMQDANEVKLMIKLYKEM